MIHFCGQTESEVFQNQSTLVIQISVVLCTNFSKVLYEHGKMKKQKPIC